MPGTPTADDVLAAFRQALRDLEANEPNSAAIPILHGILEQVERQLLD